MANEGNERRGRGGGDGAQDEEDDEEMEDGDEDTDEPTTTGIVLMARRRSIILPRKRCTEKIRKLWSKPKTRRRWRCRSALPRRRRKGL